jgi:arylsulfatase A-like enzyme
MFLNDLYMPAEEVSIAEALKSAGYDTAYIGKWHLDGHGRQNYIPPERRQGFDYWKVLECTHKYMDSKYYDNDDPTLRTWEGYDAYAQTRDAQQYIHDHTDGDKPFFLLVSFGGPHFPHNNGPEDLMAYYQSKELEFHPNVPPEQFERNHQEMPGYYAHCTAIDQCVGDLEQALEDAGIAEQTIFVFTSDHGDMHGSHGWRSWRKQLPYNEAARVPFICRYPKAHSKGREVRTPLNTTDIFPTLLSLADVPVPECVEGVDLSAMICDEAVEDDSRAALYMTVVPTYDEPNFAYRAIRTSRHTYIRDPDGRRMLFDDPADLYQMNDLADEPECAALVADLERRMQAEMDRIDDDFPTPQQALDRWGYELHAGSKILPDGKVRVVSPGPDGGIKDVPDDTASKEQA